MDAEGRRGHRPSARSLSNFHASPRGIEVMTVHVLHGLFRERGIARCPITPGGFRRVLCNAYTRADWINRRCRDFKRRIVQQVILCLCIFQGGVGPAGHAPCLTSGIALVRLALLPSHAAIDSGRFAICDSNDDYLIPLLSPVDVLDIDRRVLCPAELLKLITVASELFRQPFDCSRFRAHAAALPWLRMKSATAS